MAEWGGDDLVASRDDVLRAAILLMQARVGAAVKTHTVAELEAAETGFNRALTDYAVLLAGSLTRGLGRSGDVAVAPEQGEDLGPV